MDIKILEQLVLDDRAGKPVETSRSNYSQDFHPGLLKCGKVGAAEHDRSGKLEGNSSDLLGKLILFVENIFSAGRRIL